MIVEARMVERYYVAGVYGPEYHTAAYAYLAAALHRYARKYGNDATPIEGWANRYARWLRRADEREVQP